MMKSSDVDPLLSTPSRLAVVATLADGDWWSFTALRDATGLADGNLHVQAGRLVEAGYVERSADREGGRRVTVFRLSAAGRSALATYVERLRRALDRMPPAAAGARRRERPGELGGRSDGSRVW